MSWSNEKRYRALRDMTTEEHARLTEVVKQSPWRQVYHIQPLIGLLNDPNGFSYYNGAFHLFYQWFPYGAVHGLKHWYHTRSTDLATWTDEGLAIEPDMNFESHGAYSGSGIVHEDHLYLFYTGNVRDENWDRQANQCLAIMDKQGNIVKHEQPLICNPPEGYTTHFRDPKVWKHEDQFYFVIGAQREDLTGAVLLYRSKDLYHWELVNEVQTDYQKFGYMWECPDYIELDGKGILIFSPQGIEPDGDQYQNIFQTGYLVGERLHLESGYFNHEAFQELDAGFDFYAPQTTETPDGRRILVGWMGLPDIEYPTDRYEWAHCLTIPRELHLINGKLIQKPVPELQTRRGAATSIQDTDGSFQANFGESYELSLRFDEIEAETYGVRLRKGEQEETTLSFSRTSGKLTLDRGNSGEVPAQAFGTKRSVALDSGLLHSLHIYVDRSSIEIFANDGEAVMTARIFPNEKSVGFQTFSDGGSVQIKGTCWRIEN